MPRFQGITNFHCTKNLIFNNLKRNKYFFWKQIFKNIEKILINANSQRTYNNLIIIKIDSRLKMKEG